MDVLHDAAELGVDFFGGPVVTHGVLAHFHSGSGNTAGVNSLGGGYDALGLQESKSVVGGGHVGNFDVVLDTVGNDLFSFDHLDLILSGARHANVNLDSPGLLFGEELAAELVSIVLSLVAAGSAHLEQIVDLFFGDDSVGIIDISVGAGDGNDLGAEFSSLLADAPSDLTETGNGNGLALDVVIFMLQNFDSVVHSTVTGGFGTEVGAAEAEALTGEDAVVPSAGNALILAVQIADFTSANTDVTGRNVHVGADMTIELGHEGLAETHDFSVAAAAGVEVGAALSAADGQGGQAVFEGLLKGEELHDAHGDGGMEAQAALVGADGAVMLYAEAAVYLNITIVINPGYTEGDDAFGFNESFEQAALFVFGMLFDNYFERFENFFDGLEKFFFTRVALLDSFKNTFDISVHDEPPDMFWLII